MSERDPNAPFPPPPAAATPNQAGATTTPTPVYPPGHPLYRGPQQAPYASVQPSSAPAPSIGQQAVPQQAYPQQAPPQQAYPQQAPPQQAYPQQAPQQQAYPQQAPQQQAYAAGPMAAPLVGSPLPAEPVDGPKTTAIQSPFQPAERVSGGGWSGELAFVRNVATQGFLNYLRNIVPHTRRVFQGNLATGLASHQERVFLEDACNVKGETSQSYLVWRRSALVLMIVPLTLTAIFTIVSAFVDIYRIGHLVDDFKSELAKVPVEQLAPELARELVATVEQFVEPMVAGLTLMKLASIAITLVSIALAVLAVKTWSNYKLSRRFLLASWAIGFVLPFAISLVPVRMLLRHVPPPTNINGFPIDPRIFEDVMQKLELEIGLGFGIYMFIVLAPAVLTIFPALIRASLYVKTLLPQSPVPGWITVVVPSFYVMLIFAFFALLNQMAGDLLMLLGLFFLAASPMSYLLKARALTGPLSAQEVFPTVRGVRALAIGIGLLAVFFLTAFVLRSPILETLKFVSPVSVVQMSLDFVGKYFLMTLVACDALLRMLLTTQRRAQEQSEALRAELGARLGELAALDVTAPPRR